MDNFSYRVIQFTIDETDETVEQTALRETEEEIGLPPSSIDILGRYSALPNKTGSLRVHPYVGFIKDQHIDLTRFNPEEVSRVFTLPIEYLIDTKNREVKQFRDSPMKYPVFKVPQNMEGEKEIWGLTSFILDGIKEKDLINQCILTQFLSRRVSKNHSRILSITPQ